MIAQAYSGCCRYSSDFERGEFTLLVAVPCWFEHAPTPEYALLDTAAHWCFLPPSLAVALGLDTAVDPTVPPMHTRFGTLRGRIERVWLRLSADEGDALFAEATCFISADWPGPVVLGWKGLLERIRFGLDPGQETFYFGG